MTRSRLLARNTLLNLAGQLVPLGAAIASIRWLIHGLGPARFGVFGLAWAAIGYFGLVDLGLGRALTHAVASRLETDQEADLHDIGWTALTLMFSLGIAGAIVLALATPWLVGSVLKIPAEIREESISSFYLLALSLPFVVSVAGLRGIMEAYQHFGLATTLRVPLSLVSYLGPLAVLPFTNRLDAVIAVLVLTRVIGWAVHLWIAVRRYHFLRHGRLWVRGTIRPLLRVGGWMTVSNVVSPVMTYLDRFLIGAILSVAAVAYYVTPYEAVMKLLVFPAALTGVLFPAFTAAFSRDRAAAAALFDKCVRVIVLGLFPAVLVLVTLSAEILRLWVGPEFAAAGAPVLRWLAVGVLINGVGFGAFSFLQGIGRPDLTGKVNLIELPFYGVAIWLLARLFGVTGVAIAWTTRVLVDTIVLLFLSHSRLGDEAGRLRLPFTSWGVFAIALIAGAMMPGTVSRVAFAVVGLLVYVPAAWFLLLTSAERVAISRLFRGALDSASQLSRPAA